MRRLAAPVLALAASLAHASGEDDRLREAMRGADASSMRALVAAGADPETTLPNGKTALMVAASVGDVPLVEALLDAGAPVDARNPNGGTALMYCAVYGHEPAVRTLLGRGADVNAVGRNGWTALTLAAVKGHAGVVVRLLDAGADPNAPDVYGSTPLMRAAEERRPTTVAVLVGAHAIEIDARDDHGVTALHWAAIGGDPQVVRLLLDAGADPLARDDAGQAPADVARLHGNGEAAAALEAPGTR